ncbi:hypothetical protein GH714_011597 [Hevea brasiliensis]|uniref:Anaphase-promoting complex subunit 4 WD40 domain-containing protein n=1 Tax=Hevea brasiliensis TaxID=3981 RepID=A0A6A6L2I4_HEVBR|nr:hypothetical protein GH714_011597 [Hevea brasiliensis]
MTTVLLPPGSDRKLSSPPSDEISNLRFSNHSDRLLVSSWDKSVRLYDAGTNALRGEFMHGGPVLNCCFHDDSSGFSASADNTVRRSLLSIIGQVITGSWDKTLKCWDPRGASGQERTLVGTYSQRERVYSLSLAGNRLAVAAAGRHAFCGYAFKCHRKSEAGRDIVYPVNGIAFHPVLFLIVRCLQIEPAAMVHLRLEVVMDLLMFGMGTIKRGFISTQKYLSSIAALSFSRDGLLLAVASSYTFEEEDKP